MSTEAKRLDDVASGELPSGLDTGSICYWRHGDEWWLYLPGGGMGNLSAHRVEEHEDGTITVSPSIGLKTDPGGGYVRHGYLKRGAWHPCSDDRPPDSARNES